MDFGRNSKIMQFLDCVRKRDSSKCSPSLEALTDMKFVACSPRTSHSYILRKSLFGVLVEGLIPIPQVSVSMYLFRIFLAEAVED